MKCHICQEAPSTREVNSLPVCDACLKEAVKDWIKAWRMCLRTLVAGPTEQEVTG